MRIHFFTLFAALALPVVAEAQVYECNINQMAANGGYLPEVLALEISGDTATVNDPLIMYFKKRPVEANIVADNDKRITVSWRLKVKNSTNQYANFAYRLTILKAGLRAEMSAQPLPYDDQFAAPGKCRQVKG